MAGCRRGLLAALLIGLAVGDASGQVLSIGDPFEDYLRLLQISGQAQPGSFTVRPLSSSAVIGAWENQGHPWSSRAPFHAPSVGGSLSIQTIDPRLRVFANSRFPVGQNDGPVWQGRGFTYAMDAGALVTWRGLSMTLRPVLLYNENRSFELAPVITAGMPEYAYPWRVIDLPQRFGPESFWTFDPGDSEARVDWRGLGAGVSTSTMWWGPGIRNAIIMSNHAPGFVHGFLGTNRPLDIRIGALEGRWIWGRLQESSWFGPTNANDGRFITGIVASYAPSFLPGLTLGAIRVFTVVVPDSGVPVGDYFAVFKGLRKRALVTPENPLGNDPHDQLASLFGRWVLSESGFEVYWEWARNDHSWELRDFLLEPEHSQAYVLGLQKALTLSGRRMLALRAEFTHLEADPTFQVRPKGTYYEHSSVTQGYTQRGQVIGAGVGPGGNAQLLGVQMYAPWGRAGAYLERQVHDNDAYYAWAAANDETYCCHDVSVHFGTEALFFVGDFDLGGGFIATHEYNRYFFGLSYWNLNLSMSARWRPD